jgi:ABC-type transport system involved in multi-copper enzyme maturation permease subunit
LEIFLKDVCLTVINLFSVVLAVLFAARQIPEEVSRRTVYPLLARPISRFDLLFGKFLGAYAMSVLGLVVFTVVGLGALYAFDIHVGVIFLQFLLLRLFVLGLICALTLFFSLFMTPSATVTMSLLSTVGATTFSNAIVLVDGDSVGIGRWLLRLSYYVFPHFDLFDLSKKVSNSWDPIPGWVVVSLAFYTLLYLAVIFWGGTRRFERQAL